MSGLGYAPWFYKPHWTTFGPRNVLPGGTVPFYRYHAFYDLWQKVTVSSDGTRATFSTVVIFYFWGKPYQASQSYTIEVDTGKMLYNSSPMSEYSIEWVMDQ